jgi:hypothetical protein
MQCISSSPAALPSFSNILSTHKNASLMPQPSVPASEICWFLQTIHTVPSGAALSVSSSLSSLQCCITLLCNFMLNQLECAFVDKELDCYNGHSAEGASTHLQLETASLSPLPFSSVRLQAYITSDLKHLNKLFPTADSQCIVTDRMDSSHHRLSHAPERSDRFACIPKFSAHARRDLHSLIHKADV